MKAAISVENLGKSYVIRHEQSPRYTALRDVLMERVRGLGRRVFLPRREVASPRVTQEQFWALKGVSFEVNQGDRLGIIGRNGAGKSTLLKILSRITEPTTGRVRIRGRVASLLEVGTGFHPELTGRENIFLNGVILGMTKAEIVRKFDEIVAFAEVERFLDTPVKRYSSGMHVRLAFAVAAHLEPEILIVDEVLAVGDNQFQDKCLGKMKEIGESGRTVLFVSHNMGALQQFCSAGILLEKGEFAFKGKMKDAIGEYLARRVKHGGIEAGDFIGPLASKVHFQELLLNRTMMDDCRLPPSEELAFTIRGYCKERIPKFRTSLSIYSGDVRLATLYDNREPEALREGPFEVEIVVPPFFLRPGSFRIALGGHDGGVYSSGSEWLFNDQIACFQIFEVWGAQNDIGAVGVVNLPHTGSRRQIDDA